MKRFLPVLLPAAFALLSCSQGTGDVPRSFEKELKWSGFVSRPLPVHPEASFEHRMFSAAAFEAGMALDDTLTILYVTDPGLRAAGAPSDPDYATYGDYHAVLDLGGACLEEYNYISFKVKADSPADMAPSLNLVFINGEDGTKGGHTPPAGAHLVPLSQGENACGFWIGDLRRDCAEKLDFYITDRGWGHRGGGRAEYTITDVEIGTVDADVKVSGWEPQKGMIIHSNSGYYNDGAKTAVMNVQGAPESFSLCTEAGREVFRAPVGRVRSSLGSFAVLDFSAFAPRRRGTYYLKAADVVSEPFSIAEHPFDALQWKALNFIFGQRCGFDVKGIHPLCHQDLFAVHDGDTLCFGGGWHDAGDLSQQTLQTADVAFGLMEAARAAAVRAPALSRRLEEEALWGLDFIEKVRFADGSRASSMGLLIWQDGLTGSIDDIFSVRVQGMAFDNYLYAAYQAYAADCFKDDPVLSAALLERAERDFHYAERKFAQDGYDVFVQPYEHTFSTSRSQFMAGVSWAASLLYRCTGNEEYATRAREAISYVLSCQLQQGPGKGGFCRDTTLGTMVHQVHQSREQLFALALVSLAGTQPAHPEYGEWRRSVVSYSSYLKRLMAEAGPYGMMPSGIYSVSEPEDAEAFLQQNVFLPADAAEKFLAQISDGVEVGPGYFLKRFPVWFGIYNGNNAIILSQGKAAALCGRVLGDVQLLDIARAQLYWLLGMNPFGQSMVYGEGCGYPLMDSFSSGTITGEMPVGIRTLDASDTPYWPQVNNACYKEVWTTVAGKLLSLLAEL